MTKAPKSRKSAAGPARKKPARKTAKKVNRSSKPQERQQMIAVAAYYRAEARGFMAGGALQDWLAAEDEIDLLHGDGP